MRFCLYIILFLHGNLCFSQSTQENTDELLYFTSKYSSEDLLSTLNHTTQIDSVITISNGISISIKLIKEYSNWENGKLRCERYYHDSKPYGTWVYYDEDGTLKYSLDNFQDHYILRIHFSDKTVRSIRKFTTEISSSNVRCTEENYHPNGVTESTGSRVTAQLANHFTLVENGKWKYYYPNGNLESYGKFDNGKKEGKWTYYSFKGIKTRVVSFKNGLVVSQKLLTD